MPWLLVLVGIVTTSAAGRVPIQWASRSPATMASQCQGNKNHQSTLIPDGSTSTVGTSMCKNVPQVRIFSWHEFRSCCTSNPVSEAGIAFVSRSILVRPTKWTYDSRSSRILWGGILHQTWLLHSFSLETLCLGHCHSHDLSFQISWSSPEWWYCQHSPSQVWGISNTHLNIFYVILQEVFHWHGNQIIHLCELYALVCE